MLRDVQTRLDVLIIDDEKKIAIVVEYCHANFSVERLKAIFKDIVRKLNAEFKYYNT